MSLFNEVNNLCKEIYGKEHCEIYGFGEFAEDELEAQKKSLLKKKKKEAVVDKVLESRTVQVGNQNRTFLDIWRDVWDFSIEGQPILRDIYAFCAFSQLVDHVSFYRSKEEDLRVHICAIMPSGMGKSEGNDILAQFASIANLKYFSVERFNDAVMTGSIDREIVSKIKKEGLKQGDAGWENPYIPSKLETCDFVVFDEGEAILKATPTTEGSQRILQKAMNRHGSEGNKITNSLIGFEVKSYPKCSLVVTSYYLSEFKETLLNRGLLQRMIVYIREEDETMRTKIIDRIIGDIPSFKDDENEAFDIIKQKKKDYEILLQEMEREIMNIRDFHKETEHVIIQEKATKIISESVNELRDIMPFFVGQKQIWDSMTSRVTLQMFKIASIHALMHYRRYINEEDAQFATALLNKTMKSVGIFLSENVKTDVDKKTNEVYYQLKRFAIGNTLTVEGWVEVIVKKFGISNDRARDYVKNLERNRKFRVITMDDNKKKLLRLD